MGNDPYADYDQALAGADGNLVFEFYMMEKFYNDAITRNANTWACRAKTSVERFLGCLDIGSISNPGGMVDVSLQPEPVIGGSPSQLSVPDDSTLWGQHAKCNGDAYGDQYVGAFDLTTLVSFIFGDSMFANAIESDGNRIDPRFIYTGLSIRHSDFLSNICSISISSLKDQYFQSTCYDNVTTIPILPPSPPPPPEIRLVTSSAAVDVETRNIISRAMLGPRFAHRFNRGTRLTPFLTSPRRFETVPLMPTDTETLVLDKKDTWQGQWMTLHLMSKAMRLEAELLGVKRSSFFSTLRFEQFNSAIPPLDQAQSEIRFTRHCEYASNAVDVDYCADTCAVIVANFQDGVFRQGTFSLFQVPVSQSCAFDIHIWIPDASLDDAGSCGDLHSSPLGFGRIMLSDGDAGRQRKHLCATTREIPVPVETHPPPDALPSPPPSFPKPACNIESDDMAVDESITPWGNCSTYALGRENHELCRYDDTRSGYPVYSVCPECNQCNNSIIVRNVTVTIEYEFNVKSCNATANDSQLLQLRSAADTQCRREPAVCLYAVVTVSCDASGNGEIRRRLDAGPVYARQYSIQYVLQYQQSSTLNMTVSNYTTATKMILEAHIDGNITITSSFIVQELPPSPRPQCLYGFDKNGRIDDDYTGNLSTLPFKCVDNVTPEACSTKVPIVVVVGSHEIKRNLSMHKVCNQCGKCEAPTPPSLHSSEQQGPPSPPPPMYSMPSLPSAAPSASPSPAPSPAPPLSSLLEPSPPSTEPTGSIWVLAVVSIMGAAVVCATVVTYVVITRKRNEKAPRARIISVAHNNIVSNASHKSRKTLHRMRRPSQTQKSIGDVRITRSGRV